MGALSLVALSAYAAACWRARARVQWSPPHGRMHQGALAARLAGDNGPPVVLLHGFLGSGVYWGAAFDELGRDHRLIVPDLLGFGASAKPAGRGYGVDEHTAALAALLDEVGVDEPAVVAGHSIGALVALRFAARYPHRVRAVVAFGPPLHRDPASARQRLAALDPMAGMLTLRSDVASRSCMWFHSHPRVSAGLVRLLRPDLPPPIARDTPRHTWDSYWGTLSSFVLEPESPAWLDAVSSPVRFVAGSDDSAVDLSLLRELTDRHAGFSLRVVAGGGHNLPLNDPLLCRREIELLAE